MTYNAFKAPLMGLLLVTLAACNSKQPGEDAVATVNGYEITATELNNELAARGGQNIQDPALRRQALDELINRKLLVGLAQERELDKTPGYILNEQRMRELLLADAAVGFLATLNPKPDARKIEASVQAARGTRTIFQVEGLQFAPIADKAVMTALDRSANMSQVEQILATADVATKPASLSWDSVAMPGKLVQQLEGVPNGKPFVLSGPNGVFAGVVTGQQRQPLSPDQSRALAESVAAQATTQTTVADWLKEEKAKAEIVIRETVSGATKQPQAADPDPAQ